MPDIQHSDIRTEDQIQVDAKQDLSPRWGMMLTNVTKAFVASAKNNQQFHQSMAEQTLQQLKYSGFGAEYIGARMTDAMRTMLEMLLAAIIGGCGKTYTPSFNIGGNANLSPEEQDRLSRQQHQTPVQQLNRMKIN